LSTESRLRRARRALIAGLAALALAGCSSPSASMAPSQSAVPGSSVTASPIPSAPSQSTPPASGAPASVAPTASAPPSLLQVLPPGSALEVRVADLNLRRQPSTSARRVKVLERGDLVVISPGDGIGVGYGPVRADGYTWYPVIEVDLIDGDGELDPLPVNPIPYGAELEWGWIATDGGSEPFVRQVAPRCPASVDLENVSGMLPAERLACFGGPIVLEGTFGCSGCGGAIAGEFEPAWLASPLNFDFLSVDVLEQLGPLGLRFRPTGPPRPPAGSIVRVTLHVDDARAARCTMSEMGDGDVLVPVPSETAVYICREQLVVDSYEVLGTDPEFPLS
jgi:hypothetical protein